MSYVPNGRLTTESMAVFRRTIALCQERQIPVGIVLLPVHPYFYDLIAARADHRQNLRTVSAFLGEIRSEFSTVRAVVDASHVDRFGGSPYGFHDSLHMTRDNTAKVLDLLQEAW